MSSSSNHAQEKKIQCLNNHLQEYQKQIEQIQQELERTRGRLCTCNREQEDIKRLLTQKEDAANSYESQVENLRFELKEKEKCHQRQSNNLQEQVSRTQEQLQQKDAALIMCRNEVKSHLATMEEVKANFACELKQRENLIYQLKEDLKNLYEDLKCKGEESRQLDRNVLDLKAKLSQSSARLNEAEVTIGCLQEKMQQQENQFSQEKQQALGDMEEFEKKFNQTTNELVCVQNELRKIKKLLQDKDECLEEMSADRAGLFRELQNERDETAAYKGRVHALESDNKEICRLLQQKIHCIKDREQSLCIKKDELENCQCCVEELNAKIRELNTANGIEDDNGDDSGELKTQLKACNAAVAKVETEKEDLEKKLAYAVAEMEKLAKEVQRLKCELEEAKAEICEKEAMIADLNRTLEHAELDMESRMFRVDEQLEKYEREVKEKNRMVGECEEKCCRYQHSLSDKDMDLEDMDQKLIRAKMETDSLNAKVHEQEEARNCLQKSLGEERARFAELAQEAQYNRDMLRSSSQEASDLKRVLCLCQRDMDECRRNNDDLRISLQEKELQISTLCEEKNCLNAKLANMQCRLEEETKQLTQQMSAIKFQLENQVNQLTMSQNSLEEVNCSLKLKVGSSQRQIAEIEKNYYQKVTSLSQEVNALQEKLNEKDDKIQAAKDSLIMKDSEIMRLKLRMCDMDRCSSPKDNDKCGNAPIILNKCLRSRSNSCSSGKDVVKDSYLQSAPIVWIKERKP